MMLSLLRDRRSIRRFKPSAIEPEKVEVLIESLLRSPSSRSRRPWEFVLVDDPSLLKGLSEAKEHGSEFIAGAALAVVVCADPARCDVWIEDCSVASTILQLTAASLGLGSCWAQIRLRSHVSGRSAEDHVKALLSLPSSWVVESIIGIGYPDEQPRPHPRSTLPFDKIHRNGCGESGP